MRLADATAVVTGGGRGIGAAVVHALAAGGTRVVVVGRTVSRIQAVAAEVRGVAVACDVTDAGSVRGMADAALRQLGRVDILVNNAGASHSAPLDKVTLQDWERMLAANVTGTFLCTQALVPGMLERRWGRVINVASLAGLQGGKYIAAYSAAKHAVVGFTRSVAAEVAGTGVTCNAVCPGFVDTEMTRESVERVVAKTGRTREDTLSAMLATMGQRRLIPAAEVADAVLKLCDDGSGQVNGEAIVIDGSGAA